MERNANDKFKLSERVFKVPPYPFAVIDKAREKVKAEHPDWKVISLGIGDPDRPTDPRIRAALTDAVENEFTTHKYPKYEGHPDLRKACAKWFNKRFELNIDPFENLIITNGSKEALMHTIWAVIDPGDTILVPDPFYPVYKMGSIFTDADIVYLPLKHENDFLIDYDSIPDDAADKAKMMFICYPNNPTSKLADIDFFKRTVKFARKHNIIVVSDNAYSEIYYGDEKPPSILEVDGAMDIAIELHSFSKTYNMTGWRLGFAIGNPRLIEALEIIKSNTDSGVFTAVQKAGIKALELADEIGGETRKIYKTRRDKSIAKLKKAGFYLTPCEATLYLWVKVPEGYNATTFAAKLLEEKGVVVGPGSAWGKEGENFFRICLSTPDDDLDEALDRIIET
ncbi:LL-diaminopimelate aminotransferase [bacterium]|nr:LL-diaminopimelate aminotransferase [bacterium]